MEYFVLLKALHVISAVVWISVIFISYSIRKLLAKPEIDKKVVISVLLEQTNYFARIGMIGILLTGITLSIQLGYGFFKFASSGGHWLYTKQLLMIGIIYLTFGRLMPAAKKLKTLMETHAANTPFTAEMMGGIKKIRGAANAISILVVVSFLLAIFRLLM